MGGKMVKKVKEEDKQRIYRPENTAPRNEEEDVEGKIERNEERNVEGGEFRAERQEGWRGREIKREDKEGR